MKGDRREDSAARRTRGRAVAGDPVTRAPCVTCGRYPKTKRSTKWCEWHWLKRQPATVQVEFARARRAAWDKANWGSEPIARMAPKLWPEGERWCAGCQSFVPLFYVSGSRCRACNSAAVHDAMVTKTYGLEPGEYARIFEAQGFRCAICRGRPVDKRLSVDHDHRTGKVRGLLCARCNHELLGAAHDSRTMIVSALAYLDNPPASDAPAWWGARARLSLESQEAADPFTTPARV